MKHIQFTLVTAFVLAIAACAAKSDGIKARASNGGPTAKDQAQNAATEKVALTESSTPAAKNLVLSKASIQAMLLCQSNIEASPKLNTIALQGGTALIARQNPSTAAPANSAATAPAANPQAAGIAANTAANKQQIRPTTPALNYAGITCAGGDSDTLTSNSDVTTIALQVGQDTSTSSFQKPVKADFVNNSTVSTLNLICLAKDDSQGIADAFNKGNYDMAVAPGSKVLVTNGSTDASATKYIMITCDSDASTSTPAKAAGKSEASDEVTPGDLSDQTNTGNKSGKGANSADDATAAKGSAADTTVPAADPATAPAPTAPTASSDSTTPVSPSAAATAVNPQDRH